MSKQDLIEESEDYGYLGNSGDLGYSGFVLDYDEKTEDLNSKLELPDFPPEE